MGPVAAADLERSLAEALQRPVEVRFGRARRTVVHAQERSGVLVIRLNAFFSEAPPDVRAALATWLRSGRRASRACRLLDDWIDERLARLHREEPRRIPIRTVGEHHDLAPLAESLCGREFQGTFDDGERPWITWGRGGKSRSRHTLRLGSYDYHARVVRVHTVLDQPAVPAWFVRFVLFHELLHAELDDAPEPGERRMHHGPGFRKRERAHPDYRRATEWERVHVRSLIRSARTGQPVPTGRIGAAQSGARRLVEGAERVVQRLLFD